MFGFLKNISPVEIVVIVLILLLLFGGKVVSRLGKATGETVKEIKNIKKTINEAVDEDK